MILDTSLYKLTRNAYAILSGAYAKLPEIAISAIDVPNTPKQPRLYNQLIQVSTLFRQINTHIIYNDDNTAIIGIQGEDVDVINDLLYCLRDVAGLIGSSQFPTPFTNYDFTQVQYIPIPAGPNGSILVSNGTSWQVMEMGADGTVLTSTPTGLVYSSAVGNGIPSGGAQGQFLIKNTNNSYDVIWSSLTLSMVTDVTASPAEVNILDGVDTVNIGADQINTLVGINTSLTIQQQIDALMDNALPNNQFWVGDATDVAVPHLPTGDVTFDNTGLFAITGDVIVDADINTAAAITRSKLAVGSSYRLVINNAFGVMSEAASIFPARALISDVNGIPTHSSTTATALGYISTLTGDAQNQLNNKLTVVVSGVAQGDMLTYNGTNWVNFPIGANGEVLTSDGTSVSWGSATANGIPAGGTAEQVLRKVDGTDYNTEWHSLVMADITDVSTTAAELNLLVGLTVDAAHLNYSSNVTSDIQTQIDTKLGYSLSHHSLFVGGPSDTAIQYGAGPEGSVLTIISGHPIWQTPPPPGQVSGVAPTTDLAVVRWNGVDGDSIQNSVVIISDLGDVTGVNTMSSGQIDILDQAELRLHETGSTNYVGIRATGVMGGNYTITLPSAAPGSNTSLTYNGVDYVWGPSGGVTDFLSLTDVAATTYTGEALKLVRVNAGETGLEFVTPSGTGTVTSVSGIANRITITGTPTVNPTVDIASTYVGQATITTVGTITTGTWNGTDVALGAGGTGATLSAPVADRIFFYDFSATSSAFLEVGSGLSITGTILTATGSYTDEAAQDAVGNAFVDTSTIDFTYNDGLNQISAIVVNNSIDDTKLRAGSALSVIGRSVNSSGNVSDISASTDGYVLRRSGFTLGFGTVSATSTMTMNTSRILGRTTAAAGAVEELIVQNGLTLSSGVLKLEGTLTENTNFVGSGFNWTASGLYTYQIAADSQIVHSTTYGAAVSIKGEVGAIHQLFFGEAAGVVLNIGSDSTGDLYYRDGSGKFTRLPIGSDGQTLITSTLGIPAWSNMIVKEVNAATYDFIEEDNGKLLIFTLAGGCIATLPISTLQPQWQVLCYRLGGTVTFATPVGGTLEGVGTTMPVVETMAAIIQRDTNIFALTGSLSLIGSGTVTSVGLNNIAAFATSSGGPIIGAGSFTLTLDNQLANYGFFGPAVSGSSTPTFRAMVLKDLPNDDWSEISGPTYSFIETDNKKVKYVIHASGCVITVPSGLLTPGWGCTVYRMPGAGAVSFVSDGSSVLEGLSFIMTNEETFAIISHRDPSTDTFVVAGDLGVSAGVETFIELTDVPSSYAGQAGKVVAVNGTATGLEFISVGGGSVTSVTGTAGRITSTGGTTPVINIDTGYVGQSSITTLGTITTGTWTGSVISTTYTQAKVASITGTTNRITIAGTATVPTVDISTSYAGQNTITTLGTVTTGTWNATAITPTYGGTGLTSIGTANQVLAVNNAATALEYKTISLGTTAQSNNLGWVLTGPNAIVLHVPDASGTVRGVMTTAAQTFAGAKTFSNTPTFSTMTLGSVLFAGTAGILTQDNASFFWDDTNNRLGLGTNVTTGSANRLIITDSQNSSAGIRITNTNTGGSARASLQLYNSGGSFGEINLTPFGLATSGARRENQLEFFAQGSGGFHFLTSSTQPISFSISGPLITKFAVTNTGVAIGNGVIGTNPLTSPTASLHLPAGTATAGTAPLKFTTGTAVSVIAAGVNDGAMEYHSSHLYFTIGSTRYQLDQQSGTLADGDKGDITVSASGATWTIDNDAVTYAKIQNVVNNNRFLGRISGAAGDIEELTGTQATTLLDLFSTSSTLKGLVPGSNSVGATFFLNATGAWSVPAGGGGTPGGSNTHVQFNSSGAFGGNSGMTYAESPAGTFLLSLGTASTTNIGKLTLGGATGSGNITANADLSLNLTPTTNGFRVIMGGTNRFQINNNGAALFNSSAGTSGQMLTSAGTGSPPTWTTILTNTAAANELAMSDGTNLDPSGLFITGTSNLTLGGAATSGTTRYIQALGAATDMKLFLYPKGAGDIELATLTGSSVIIGNNSGAGSATLEVGSSDTNAGLFINPKGTGAIELGTNTSGIVYVGSNSTTGNRVMTIGSSSTNAEFQINSKGTGDLILNSGGDIEHIITTGQIRFGNPAGIHIQYDKTFLGMNWLSSVDANFVIGCDSGFDVVIGNNGNNVSFFNTAIAWTTQDSVIGIEHAQTAPTAAIAGVVQLYVQDVTSSGLATLGIWAEEAVEASVAHTQSHRFKVKINGTEYWLSLDAV